MDEEKYCDSYGRIVDLLYMCQNEPDWAAERVKVGEKALDEVKQLQDENKKLRYENEQLRETVTNQEIVIRCHQEACQSLDIGIGD